MIVEDILCEIPCTSSRVICEVSLWSHRTIRQNGLDYLPLIVREQDFCENTGRHNKFGIVELRCVAALSQV